MTDEHDYPWCTDCTPEQRELNVYIDQDASDPDSLALSKRQQTNWDEFQERVARDHHTAKKAFTAPRAIRKSMWWELWTPPTVNGRLLPAYRLLQQGEVTVHDEWESRDVGFGGWPVRHLLTSHRIYMDFMPADVWAFFEHFTAQANEDKPCWMQGMLTHDDLHGDWGWWDSDRVGFRQLLQSYKVQYDPEHPELGYTGFAAKMMAPPPYGMWLPVLDFDEV
jgi:hypothetical protein